MPNELRTTRLYLTYVFLDIHPDGFAGWVKEQREAATSWNDIAIELEKKCGYATSGRTVHRMFIKEPWAQGPTPWWKSEQVKERRERRKELAKIPMLKAAE